MCDIDSLVIHVLIKINLDCSFLTCFVSVKLQVEHQDAIDNKGIHFDTVRCRARNGYVQFRYRALTILYLIID
jgi:hypothetical protein